MDKIQQSPMDIQDLAKFPDENPYPLLRVSSDGVMLYANRRSSPVLEAWKYQVGGVLPRKWREDVLLHEVRSLVAACLKGRTEVATNE